MAHGLCGLKLCGEWISLAKKWLIMFLNVTNAGDRPEPAYVLSVVANRAPFACSFVAGYILECDIDNRVVVGFVMPRIKEVHARLKDSTRHVAPVEHAIV